MRISKKELRELCKAMKAWADAEYALGVAHAIESENIRNTLSADRMAQMHKVLNCLVLEHSEFCDLAETLPLKLDCKCRATNCGRCWGSEADNE